MSSNNAERIRRMWDEVSDAPLSNAHAAALADALAAEGDVTPRPAHKERVLAAALTTAAERREAGFVDDRAFRTLLDQGTQSVGTWRLLDAVRPQLLLLSWSYWVTAALLFVLGALALPQVQGWGANALIVTVPLLGLISLLYTLRSGNHRMREWERSCPVTPFQVALARLTLVLGITLSAALVASLVLVRQEMGPPVAALTVSWFAPLLLIVGAYLSGDVWGGGPAGPAAGSLAWLAHLGLTRGGRVGTSVAISSEGFALSTLDGVSLIVGVVLLAAGLWWSGRRGEAVDEHHAR